jgi:hypothetical protein
MTRIDTPTEDKAVSGKAANFLAAITLVLSGFLALATFAAS